MIRFRLVGGPTGALAVMAAILPPGAVVAARLAWPVDGPAVTRAAEREIAPTEPLAWSPQVLTDAQRDAQTRATACVALPPGPSPFPQPTPVPVKAGKATEPQTPLERRAAEFSLTSILNGQQPVAIVNGKVCRIGGKVTSKAGEAWIVTAIDAATGTVEVENASFGTLTLRLPSAGEQAP